MTVRRSNAAALAALVLTVLGRPGSGTAQGTLAAETAPIQALMARTGTPGVSAALIRDCKVAEARAWGVGNTLLQTPLRTDERMQAASIGKPVAALGLVRLAREGRLGLGLDTPIGALGPALGLRPEAQATKISLREFLSHTSGLPQTGHTLQSPPGVRFQYSGAGFYAAQRLADLQLRGPFVTAVKGQVFQPLQMGQSAYDGPPVSAPGHLSVLSILTFLAPPWGAIAALYWGAALFWRRARTRHWGLALTPFLVGLGLGAVGAGLILMGPLGPPVLPTLFGLEALIILAGALGAVAADRLKGPGRGWRAAAGAALVIVLSLMVARNLLVPFPTRLGGAGGNVAFSLTTTPSDLARFAIGLMQPPPEMADDAQTMLQPRIAAAPGVEWGTGIGRVRLPDGSKGLWQWGGNPGVKGLLLARPAHCDGLVVLTNGPRGDEVYRALSRDVLGIDPNWKVP